MEKDGKRVVILGGGVAGSVVAKSLQFHAHVTLVDPKEYFEITWASLRCMVEPSFAERSLINHRDYLTNGDIITSNAVNVTETEVLTADGHRIGYDYLVIATGHADPLPKSRRERLNQFKEDNREIKSAQSILIIGGGPTGVELAGEIAVDFPDKKLTLVHKGARLLEFVGAKAGDKTLNWLKSKNVVVKRSKLKVKFARNKMGRNHFQQQHCADGSMWMESQGQQQSYAFQEESWSPDNNYGHNHKQFPGMHMNMNNNNNNNKRLGAFAAVDSDFSMQKHHHGHGNGVGAMHMNMNRHGGKLGGMFQEGMHSDHHGGRKFPFGGHHHGNNNASQHHFPNHGGHHEYFSEESEEYEESYAEEHVGGVTAKVDEMRYERHNWGGGDTRYANPYGMNMNHKPHKFQWTAKGV